MIDLATTIRQTLRVDECVEIFGVSRRTIYNWIDRGWLLVDEPDGQGCRVLVASARELAARRTPPGLLVVVQEVHSNPS